MRFKVWNSVAAVTLFSSLVLPVSLAAQESSSKDHKSKHQWYKLIDIGTFGGPSSSVPGPNVNIVNNRGTIMGAADTPTSDLPDCFFNDCFIQHTFTWQNGVVADLGALPGVNSSFPNWINKTGVIVGVSENGVIDPLVGGPEVDAVIWNDGKIVNLGTLGGNQSFGIAINNRGQAVGTALNAITDPFSLFGLGTQSRAFLWQNGVMEDLGTLGGPDATAQGVNEFGQVAGTSYTNSTPNSTTGIPTLDPFLWEQGKMIDLGTLGGTIGSVSYLNQRGQVAGASNLAGDLASHPFSWSRGVLTDLGTLGGTNGSTSWINDDGDVVGEADLPGDQIHHAFLWKDSRMTDLGTANGAPCSNAFSINSERQVVGDSTNCFGVALNAFIWENGSIADLNTLIPSGSGLQLISAQYINDRGEIAGNAVLPNGDTRAFLLIPNGDCDDDCEARVAASQNTAVSAPNSATMKQGSETLVSPLERFRSELTKHHRRGT